MVPNVVKRDKSDNVLEVIDDGVVKKETSSRVEGKNCEN